MQPYANRSGRSGVVAWEADATSIRVRFADGGTYLYNGARPGAEKVEAMKVLARRGEGLATFINRFVRDDYDRRES
jgi:hypothetical protein